MATKFTVTTWVNEDRGRTEHQYQLEPQGTFETLEAANEFSLEVATKLSCYEADSKHPYTAFTVVEKWEENEDGEFEFIESMDDDGHIFANGTWENGVLTITTSL